MMRFEGREILRLGDWETRGGGDGETGRLGGRQSRKNYIFSR